MGKDEGAARRMRCAARAASRGGREELSDPFLAVRIENKADSGRTGRGKGQVPKSGSRRQRVGGVLHQPPT